MVEYILSYGGPAEHSGPLPATRLASRKILIEQNIKKQTGPALSVLCVHNILDYMQILYRQESDLAISSSPVTNNYVQCEKLKKFLAVRQVSAG